jgi:hypothetical protein
MKGRVSWLHNRLRFDENFHFESESPTLAINLMLAQEKKNWKKFLGDTSEELKRF